MYDPDWVFFVPIDVASLVTLLSDKLVPAVRKIKTKPHGVQQTQLSRSRGPSISETVRGMRFLLLSRHSHAFGGHVFRALILSENLSVVLDLRVGLSEELNGVHA